MLMSTNQQLKTSMKSNSYAIVEKQWMSRGVNGEIKVNGMEKKWSFILVSIFIIYSLLLNQESVKNKIVNVFNNLWF